MPFNPRSSNHRAGERLDSRSMFRVTAALLFGSVFGACGGGNHQTPAGGPCTSTGACQKGLGCFNVYQTSGASVCGFVIDSICAVPCVSDSDCATTGVDGGPGTCIQECAGAPLRCVAN
jgi:hypothetical protein